MGKTTCAAARAVVEARAGRRVLVVSTDPAHSLGDALGTRLSSAPRAIPHRGGGSLRAVELDAPRAFARWLADHRGELGEIIEHGTWLDRADVDALLDLSIPGVDELVGLLEIARLSAAGKAPTDLVVVDTAPTGHALRLLASPEAVAVVARVLDDLQQEHRVVREQLARVVRPEAADRLIALLTEQAETLARQLRDPRQTAFHWVTAPEELAVAETGDAIAALEANGIHVEQVIVNRVLPDDGPCPLCDRRRRYERTLIAALRRRFGRRRQISVVKAEPREPRGIKALSKIGHLLAASRSSFDALRMSGSRRSSLVVSLSPFGAAQDDHERTVSAEALPAFASAQLLFFGGKGGVGKTTVAAAAALRIARANPRRRVLLLSTDPAHSLGDVFGAPVGDTPSPVRGAPRNLVVREIDAHAELMRRQGDLESALHDIAGSRGGGDHAAELMQLAPPGIDELFGMLTVMDARDRYSLIVIDTAPTGHALRLLEMPETAREWVQLLIRFLLKYRSLVRPGQLAAELVKMSQSIRALQSLLRDRTRTRFIVVTRVAELPRAETERLIARLRRLKLATPAIVANAMTLAPGGCAWCRRTAAAERAGVRALQRVFGRRSRDCVIIQTPLTAPPPRGVRALNHWAQRWI